MATRKENPSTGGWIAIGAAAWVFGWWVGWFKGKKAATEEAKDQWADHSGCFVSGVKYRLKLKEEGVSVNLPFVLPAPSGDGWIYFTAPQLPPMPDGSCVQIPPDVRAKVELQYLKTLQKSDSLYGHRSIAGWL